MRLFIYTCVCVIVLAVSGYFFLNSLVDAFHMPAISPSLSVGVCLKHKPPVEPWEKQDDFIKSIAQVGTTQYVIVDTYNMNKSICMSEAFSFDYIESSYKIVTCDAYAAICVNTYKDNFGTGFWEAR